MRLLRWLFISGSAAVAAGSLLLGGEVAVTTTAAGHAPPAGARVSAHLLAEARSALVRYLRESDPADAQPGGSNESAGQDAGRSARAGGSSPAQSYNWSGYADASHTDKGFSAVGGQWRTPAVHCTREDEISSAWVGLDGFTNSTVEQAGTVSWCFRGVATYYTWYEMVPAGTVEVGKALRPGDQITARISRSGTSYTLSVTDSTHPANGFSVTKTCTNCRATSAEWITERPFFTTTGTAPLADYSAWKLAGATETARGATGTISSFSPSYKITMVDSTDTYHLSVPSPLTRGGTEFATRWRNSY
jgi:hypothetical protein